TTKDPFDYSGLSAQVKGGSNDLVNTQFRFAETLGKDKRFGYKIVAEYMSAKDWIADDNEINRYGDLEVDVNLTEILTQLQYDETLSAEDRDDYKSLNTYMWFYPLAQPGTITLNAPGYMESDLSDNSVESIKASMGLYYKFSDSLRLSYLPKWGKGTAVYQGSNRYSIKDITAFQHKLELTGHNFFLKGYSTYENAGNSYDIVFTGINLSKSAAADYTAEYLGEYFNALSDLTNEFSGSPQAWAVDSAHNHAQTTASQQWYQKGTAKFDSAYSAIVSNPDLKEGSKFLDKSALHHIEGQYNINTKAFDMIMGASYRLYEPNSYGSIFSDTILDRGDTLADGSLDLNADFAEISVYEFGAFSQLSKRLCNDKLKITASARMDKSKNYDWQFSPRFSAVYTIKDNNFRFSVQQAFRSPTLQNQYLLLDIGPIILSGNLNGASNMYTFASVIDFMDTYNNSFDVDESILEILSIKPIKPEQLTSFELGYRGILDQGFYVDMDIYYNLYSNFIGDIRGYKLLGDAVAGEETGVDALLPHTDEQPNHELYQYPVNASEEVISYGGSVGLVYYFNKHYSAKANFTYSEIDTSALTDPIIPGYNTPSHKLNFGITAKDIFDGWGMSLNYKWSQGFLWESPFADGDVPAFAMFDIQVRYKYKEWNSVFKLGASNLLNNKHIEAYGGPRVGRLLYLSWVYDFIH
ncbi:MAG TPA: TonB-dependent receptor, partial [Bacteroidetes bacterium]|nr:TonB-dependent receptor [Bacteroidota bacterium]